MKNETKICRSNFMLFIGHGWLCRSLLQGFNSSHIVLMLLSERYGLCIVQTYQSVAVVFVVVAASQDVAKHSPLVAAVFVVEQKNSHILPSVLAPCQWPGNNTKNYNVNGRKDGAVVRALASHQCSLLFRLNVICGSSLLLVLIIAPRVFYSSSSIFFLLQNQHLELDSDLICCFALPTACKFVSQL